MNSLFRKILIVSFLLPAAAVLLQAAGGTDSGRSNAADKVSGGQLLPEGLIDPGSYLEDFECDVVNEGDEPLVVSAELMHGSIWETGGMTALRITLAANGEDFFSEQPGTYIMFFQNPQLLERSGFLIGMEDILAERGMVTIRVFDPGFDVLVDIPDLRTFRAEAGRLARQEKSYDQNVLLQSVLEAVTEQEFERAHILWVTDENIAERPADLNFFDFAVRLFAGTDTTLSYLAYGEIPDWPAINRSLVSHNGNSYYARGIPAILDKIDDDIGYFKRPAVGTVEVSLELSRTAGALAQWYPADYYGTIPNFYPTLNNDRPRYLHTIGGMNHGETRRYIHYLRVPSLWSLEELADPTPFLDGDIFNIARVSVRYRLPGRDGWTHFQQDLRLRYLPAESAGQPEVNPHVELDMILQNTPLVLMEAARLVNSQRNYLTALVLLRAQRDLLRSYGSTRPEDAIDEDIATLEKYYETVYRQSISMKLLK